MSNSLKQFLDNMEIEERIRNSDYDDHDNIFDEDEDNFFDEEELDMVFKLNR